MVVQTSLSTYIVQNAVTMLGLCKRQVSRSGDVNSGRRRSSQLVVHLFRVPLRSVVPFPRCVRPRFHRMLPNWIRLTSMEASRFYIGIAYICFDQMRS